MLCNLYKIQPEIFNIGLDSQRPYPHDLKGMLMNCRYIPPKVDTTIPQQQCHNQIANINV